MFGPLWPRGPRISRIEPWLSSSNPIGRDLAQIGLRSRLGSFRCGLPSLTRFAHIRPAHCRLIAPDGGWLRRGLSRLGDAVERFAAPIRVDSDLVLAISLIHLLSSSLLAFFTASFVKKNLGFAAPMSEPTNDTVSSRGLLSRDPLDDAMDVDPPQPSNAPPLAAPQGLPFPGPLVNSVHEPVYQDM